MNWLIDNHPSYDGMQRPENCPQPILLGGFEETVNNTDKPGTNVTGVETSFDGEQLSYSSRNEPSDQLDPSKVKRILYFLILKDKNQHYYLDVVI